MMNENQPLIYKFVCEEIDERTRKEILFNGGTIEQFSPLPDSIGDLLVTVAARWLHDDEQHDSFYELPDAAILKLCPAEHYYKLVLVN